MKAFSVLVLASWLGLSNMSEAQNTSAADAALERKAYEERFSALNAKIMNILENQEFLLRRQEKLDQRVDSLEREVRKVKEDNARSGANHVTREELKSLVEKVQEIDKNREADKKLILENIRELGKAPLKAVAQEKAPAKPAENIEKYEYTVKQGEFLGDIVTAYNTLFKEQGLGTISLKEVEKANPGLNPNKIRVGQILLIPIPAKR